MPTTTHKYDHRTPIVELRLAAIFKMGSACSRCGFDDPRALEMDHIEPLNKTGGKRQATAQVYLGILNGNEQNFQLLCANCHAIKSYEEDDHPRASKESGEALGSSMSKAAAEAKKISRGTKTKIRQSPLTNHYWSKSLGVSVAAIVYVREH